MKSRDDVAPGRIPPSAARLVPIVIPALVLAATLAVVGWSSWPLLRPAREVVVVQAVFDRSQQPPSPNPGEAPKKHIPTVQAPGWLEAEPFFTACTALADGVVESIEVLEGDRVERGQIVARLVQDDAKLSLRQSEADLAIARANLGAAAAERDAAQQAWDNPVELHRAIQSGKASVAESEAELNQLPARIDSADATLTRLVEEEARVKDSTKQGAASEFELIVARQRATAQRADVAALEAMRGILEARADRLRSELRAAERNLELRIDDRRRLATAEASLAAAQASVGLAEARRDEAALELDRMIIRAPVSGYVQRRLVAPGDKVVRMMDAPHSAHLVHIYDPSRLQVRVDVPLADASHISVGQACEVVVEVLPDTTFRGEVLRITHEADLQKNTLQVKVKVLNPDPVLRPEMLTRVKFLPPQGVHGLTPRATGGASGAETQAVLVPSDAVERDSGSARVWLVTNRKNGRGVLAARNVTVEREPQPGWLLISGHLQPGDLVVDSPNKPREGEHVVIRAAQNEGVRS